MIDQPTRSGKLIHGVHLHQPTTNRVHRSSDVTEDTFITQFTTTWAPTPDERKISLSITPAFLPSVIRDFDSA